MLFCATDYDRLFVHDCKGCGEKIRSGGFEALGSHWHGECFKCQMCEQIITSEFFQQNERPCCKACLIAEGGGLDCPGCGNPISSEVVKSMGKLWHIDCLVCKECGGRLAVEIIFVSHPLV